MTSVERKGCSNHQDNRNGNEGVIKVVKTAIILDLENIANWKTLSFPEKLLYILDSGVQKHIITWMEHGNSFLVMNTVALVRQVLNVYCKEAKLTSFDSFEQELHRWGFVKRKAANREGSTEFRHKKFGRQNHALCKEMWRSSLEHNFDDLKKKSVNGRASVSDERRCLKNELHRNSLIASLRRRPFNPPSSGNPNFYKTMIEMRNIHKRVVGIAMRDLIKRQADNKNIQMKINSLRRRHS